MVIDVFKSIEATTVGFTPLLLLSRELISQGHAEIPYEMDLPRLHVGDLQSIVVSFTISLDGGIGGGDHSVFTRFFCSFFCKRFFVNFVCKLFSSFPSPNVSNIFS